MLRPKGNNRPHANGATKLCHINIKKNEKEKQPNLFQQQYTSKFVLNFQVLSSQVQNTWSNEKRQEATTVTTAVRFIVVEGR